MNELLSSSAVWGVALTLAAFALGRVAQSVTKQKWLNPLIPASALIIVLLTVLNIPYADYKESATPVTYLLLPATVALAVPLYEAWSKLQNKLPAILVGIASGSLTGVAASFLLCKLFAVPKEYAVSFLPKSVTTAIGIDVTNELGGHVSLAIVLIVLTGIAGNVLAVLFCRLFRVEDSVARGAAIGSCSHAIGTTKALELGEMEGAVSSLAIAVAGVLTAVLCPLFAALL